MRLYHGTASYNLESFVTEGPQMRPRHYIGGFKRTFCTSISFNTASVFAFRKTPMSDLSKCGIVLEFDGSGLIKDIDFSRCKDPIALLDEKEVSVLKLEKLKLVAYWKFENNNWNKIELHENTTAKKTIRRRRRNS